MNEETNILDGIYAELLGLQKQIFELSLMLCGKGVITIEDAKRLSDIAQKAIDEQKTHNEWVIIKSPLSDEIIVKCPICGEEFIGNDVEDYNFCPNCGADMKGGAE